MALKTFVGENGPYLEIVADLFTVVFFLIPGAGRKIESGEDKYKQ
jgi:hypothetical protein